MAKNVCLDSMDQKLALANVARMNEQRQEQKQQFLQQMLLLFLLMLVGRCHHGQEQISIQLLKLSVSTAAGMTYFIVANKTIMKTARQNSFKQLG
ncbi:hypothetical protein MTR67_053283 [Solanum verrucosum]|uniref:Uncharacterized protein n=1 Tax=Solanum verrucosum TaxID=315347 RepID=A0AAF1A3J8_SOLVR|nr:hypothetical protein MTR67_053283 [Solanum verrucosum]